MCAALLSLVAGCSGINMTKSVSPIDFLIPGGGSLMRGFMYNAPAGCPTNAVPESPATTPAAIKQVAQAN
jgi:hypothetical protein